MLTILGIGAIVVFTIQVYKTAVGTGRNGALWAALTAAIGIGVQFIIPICIGMAIGIYMVATGGPIDTIDTEYSGVFMVLGVAGIVLSIVGMWLVFRHVSKVTDDGTAFQTPPPPPSTFGQ